MSNVYALSFDPPGAILDVYERETHQSRDEENIRNRFRLIDIGYSIFSTMQLTQEPRSEDILATVISQGINFSN